MEAIITNLQSESTTMQALGVSAGGLIGVFATLALFFVFIWLADKLSKKKSE